MKLDTVLSSLILAAAVGSVADAGAKLPHEVVYGSSFNYVAGNLGTARNTADTTQYIGCQTYVWGVGTPARTALCYGRTSAGVYRTCTTTDPTVIAQIDALHSDSYLEFEYDATTGSCLYVSVTNDSRQEPKL